MNLRNGNKQYGLITIWNLNYMTIEYEIRTNNLKIIFIEIKKKQTKIYNI